MFIVVRCYQTATLGSFSINDVVSVVHGRVMETVSRRFDRDTNLSFQRQDADQAAPSSFTAPTLRSTSGGQSVLLLDSPARLDMESCRVTSILWWTEQLSNADLLCRASKCCLSHPFSLGRCPLDISIVRQRDRAQDYGIRHNIPVVS